MQFIAHIRSDDKMEQLISAHVEETAKLAVDQRGRALCRACGLKQFVAPYIPSDHLVAPYAGRVD